MDNPLLAADTEHPDFATLRAGDVAPAIERLLRDAEAALEQAVSAAVPAEYDALSLVLDLPVERLRRVWGTVVHLHTVADTAAWRDAYAEALPRVTAFQTRLGADQRLYAKYKELAASPAAASLAPERRKALDDALRDFRLGGAELEGAARARFVAIQARTAELSQQFSQNLLDATDAFACYVGEGDLPGVPAHVVAAGRAEAAEEGRAGVKLTLHAPRLMPVLQYCSDRALRERLYRAYHTLASEFGRADWDNARLMRELVSLRDEEARLLGYGSYAEVSLVTKMAGTPQKVLDFIADASRRARPHAERELADLRAFAAGQLGLAELEPWDRQYASEKLRESRYAFSGSEVQQYFTEPRVVEGLFKLAESLFEIAIKPARAPVWHDSVRYYEIERGGQPVAGFYLDLHARPGKQAGAWMDEARSRWRRPDGSGLQRPVARLICNFAPPAGGRPSLLTHDDVITLFHEFGHGLHHMLTQVDELAVSGIAGVEWDAAELPSQFMENFCWEWDVVQRLTSHVDTGLPLPRTLFDRMVAARHFQSSLGILRNCEYALFDMRLHSEPDAGERVQRIADEVNLELAVVRNPPFMRYPNAFSHLFDGGYAAGYYGYAWAEVLSADAYSAFEESGIFNTDTGRRYRTEILEAGGSRPALASFVAFRGREPRLDAWLRHQGIA